MFEHFPELVKDIDTGNTTYTMKDEKNKKPLHIQTHCNETARTPKTNSIS